MKPIQMVDLVSQHARIQEELNNAMQEVVQSARFIKGPAVQQFEEALARYLGVGETLGVANGTDALQVAFQALDLPPGSEVLVPSFNYVAAAEVLMLLGLKPVFVDADAATFNVPLEHWEAAITENTRAMVVVHLFGQCNPMEPIMELANTHNLWVVEDNAQAIGADIQAFGKTHKSGTVGHIGTTSFFPSKNLGCMGDGGAVYSHDAAMMTRMRSIANHGQFKKYTYHRIGINSRLDTLQAAILDVKLRYLDTYIAARQQAADFYDQMFGSWDSLEIPARAPHSTHVFHQYTLKLAPGINRNAIKEALAQQKVPSMVYYPSPLNLNPAYEPAGYGPGAMPVAEQLSQQVLSLPMHPELTGEQQHYIVEKLDLALQEQIMQA